MNVNVMISVVFLTVAGVCSIPTGGFTDIDISAVSNSSINAGISQITGSHTNDDTDHRYVCITNGTISSLFYIDDSGYHSASINIDSCYQMVQLMTVDAVLPLNFSTGKTGYAGQGQIDQFDIYEFGKLGELVTQEDLRLYIPSLDSLSLVGLTKTNKLFITRPTFATIDDYTEVTITLRASQSVSAILSIQDGNIVEFIADSSDNSTTLRYRYDNLTVFKAIKLSHHIHASVILDNVNGSRALAYTRDADTYRTAVIDMSVDIDAGRLELVGDVYDNDICGLCKLANMASLQYFFLIPNLPNTTFTAFYLIRKTPPWSTIQFTLPAGRQSTSDLFSMPMQLGNSFILAYSDGLKFYSQAFRICNISIPYFEPASQICYSKENVPAGLGTKDKQYMILTNCSISNIQYCSRCQVDDYQQCGECDSEHTINATIGQCVPRCSVANCDSCVTNDPTTCFACQKGYKLTNNETECRNCLIEGCSLCTANNSSTCQICSTGLQKLKNGTECRLCRVSNCAECSPNSPYTCTICAINYTLNGNYSCSSISNNDTASTDNNPVALTSLDTIYAYYSPQTYRATVAFKLPLTKSMFHNLSVTAVDEVSGTRITLADSQFSVNIDDAWNRKAYVRMHPAESIVKGYVILRTNQSIVRRAGRELEVLMPEDDPDNIVIKGFHWSGEENKNIKAALSFFNVLNVLRIISIILFSTRLSPRSFWVTQVFAWLQVLSYQPGVYLVYPDRLLTLHRNWNILGIRLGNPWTNFLNGTPCKPSENLPLLQANCNFMANYGDTIIIVMAVFVITGAVSLGYVIWRRFGGKRGTKIEVVRKSIHRACMGLGIRFFFELAEALKYPAILFGVINILNPTTGDAKVLGLFFTYTALVFYFFTCGIATWVGYTLCREDDQLKEDAPGPFGIQVEEMNTYQGWREAFAGYSFLGLRCPRSKVQRFIFIIIPIIELLMITTIGLITVLDFKMPSINLAVISTLIILRIAYMMLLYNLFIRKSQWYMGFAVDILSLFYLVLQISANQVQSERIRQYVFGIFMTIFISCIWVVCLLDIILSFWHLVTNWNIRSNKYESPVIRSRRNTKRESIDINEHAPTNSERNIILENRVSLQYPVAAIAVKETARKSPFNAYKDSRRDSTLASLPLARGIQMTRYTEEQPNPNKNDPG